MANLRQQIVDAIETRLKTIRVANGYQTEAGQHVFPWRLVPIPDSDMPALCIYDTDCNMSPDGAIGYFTHELQVDIDAIVSGSASRTTVRSIMEDVFRAVGVDRTWGGLAEHTEIQSHGINLEQAERVLGAGQVRMTVRYRASLWAM